MTRVKTATRVAKMQHAMRESQAESFPSTGQAGSIYGETVMNPAGSGVVTVVRAAEGGSSDERTEPYRPAASARP
jgi:hypothetical protein